MAGGNKEASTPPDVQRTGKPRAIGSLGPHEWILFGLTWNQSLHPPVCNGWRPGDLTFMKQFLSYVPSVVSKSGFRNTLTLEWTFQKLRLGDAPLKINLGPRPASTQLLGDFENPVSLEPMSRNAYHTIPAGYLGHFQLTHLKASTQISLSGDSHQERITIRGLTLRLKPP